MCLLTILVIIAIVEIAQSRLKLSEMFQSSTAKKAYLISFSIIGFVWILGVGLISGKVNTMKSAESHFEKLI